MGSSGAGLYIGVGFYTGIDIGVGWELFYDQVVTELLTFPPQLPKL